MCGVYAFEMVLTLVLIGLLAVGPTDCLLTSSNLTTEVVADRLLVELQKVQQVAMSRDNGRSFASEVRRPGTQTGGA